jgi:single-strand DNA-binding protein
MNKVFLLGNLGSDAELKVMSSGATVLKFSLATSEKWVNKNGEKQEKTQWHKAELWGERGAKLAQYLSKGTKVVVEGSIDYQTYEKDNEKKYFTSIKVSNLEFAGGKRSESTLNAATAPNDLDELPETLGDSEVPF